MVPPVVGPLPVAVPQLPFAADPGSITGWMLKQSANDSTLDIVTQTGQGLAHIGTMPVDPADPQYITALRGLENEVLNSDTLTPYLSVSNTPHDSPMVTVIHSLARYSSGSGGAVALHGNVLGLMGEMMGDQLPVLIKLMPNKGLDVGNGLKLEVVTIPPEATVELYFDRAEAVHVMLAVTVANGAVESNISSLCPLPIAWAPYFLDFKTPWEAYKMGKLLMTMLATADERALAEQIKDWLRACCRRAGNTQATRGHSIMTLDALPTAPAPGVITWMQRRLQPYRLEHRGLPPAVPPAVMAGGGGEIWGEAPIVGGAATREYSPLEVDKIQAVCGITDAEWNALCPTECWKKVGR